MMERHARQEQRRQTYRNMLDLRKEFKGKLQNLVVATVVGLDDALLVDDVPTALLYAQRLGMVDGEAQPFDEKLIRKARWILRAGRVKKERVDGHLLEVPEHEKTFRRETLASMRYVCPKCGERKPSLGMWAWPKKDRNAMPMCRVCHYQRRGVVTGGKAGEPPADLVCPLCKRRCPKRRQWAVKISPMVCRRCHRRVSKLAVTSREQGSSDLGDAE